MKCSITGAVLFLAAVALRSQPFESKPADPFYAKFQLLQAPAPAGLQLRKGDRLAICGDSITEAKMYSRMMETYLTACVPELEITVRQYGWGGEMAAGFLARMTNDCLRFQPTIATTCYGMNDHRYRSYEESIGATYRDRSTAVVRSFKAAGVRVIQGSPGCVGQRPEKFWDAAGVEAKNLNLSKLRNIGIEIARAEEVGFADVFWPMLQAGFEGQKKFGTNYAIAGKDGVHPDWAGHLVMAYAFLKAMGLTGEIATITVDLESKQVTLSPGHELVSAREGEIRIKSTRYPFCAKGTNNSDASIRSAFALIPFQSELNRFKLVARSGSAAKYKVTWGTDSRTYTTNQLAAGINLAEDFEVNPFNDAFTRVDLAVAAKQEYETRQIQMLFHGPEGAADLEATATLTEKARVPLARAVRRTLVPVTHTVRIVPE